MSLLVCVLTDIIHLLKIVLLCNMFFIFEKRITCYRRLANVIVVFVMIVTSIGIYIYDDDMMETVVYISVITLLLMLLYKEKVSSIIITSIWIIFVMSMLDMMTIVLVETISGLVNFKQKLYYQFIAGIISILLVYIIGKLYNRKYSRGIITIGLRNLISFTLLTIADTYVVMVMAVIEISEYFNNQGIAYSIAFIVVIIGIFIQLGAVILLFMQSNVYKEKKQITEKYLNEQINHYEYLEKREVETKRFRHDLRNHMQMLSNLAHNGQYDKIDEYLDVMNVKVETFGNVITVQNGIADAIINQYYARALQEDIKMDVKGMFPRECSVEAYDLCTILSNVLSNALEAAVKADEKKISMDCRYNDKNIIFVVKNTYKDFGQFKNDKIKTSKEDIDYHGYGLINIKESVEKYNGVLDIETINGEFILKVSLNYTRRNNEDSSRR